MKSATQTRLRRIALACQGLDKRQPFGRGAAAVAQIVKHLGYVQIDTISVVERAHHHVLWARAPDYRPEYLQRLIADKTLFEYWYHAAAFLPISDFRFCLPRMHAIRGGEKHWYTDIDPKLMREVKARVRGEGPLRARDFEQPAGVAGGSGWWDWKPAKKALEQLFMQGELMIVAREGFQKRYDLTERALPSSVDTRMPDHAEQAAYLIDTSLRAHGFASRKTFSYLRKGAALRNAIQQHLLQREADAQLERLQTPDGTEFFMPCGLLEQQGVRIQRRVRLLSPFDNAVIQRQRLSAVFGYDYQIECYVPALKRVYGYFSLPVLYGDKFVGRIDCKAHRKSSLLKVNEVFFEDGAVAGRSDAMLASLGTALREFADFNGCSEIELAGKNCRRFRAALLPT